MNIAEWVAGLAIVGSAGAGGYLIGWAQTKRASNPIPEGATAKWADILAEVKSEASTGAINIDSGLPASTTPMDLPARGAAVPMESAWGDRTSNDRGKRILAIEAAAVPVPAVYVPGEIHPAVAVPTVSQWRRLVDAVAAWLLTLPEPVLYLIALVMALWPAVPEPVRPLNAPMAYRPPVAPTIRAVVPAPRSARRETAAELIERLRHERGAGKMTARPSQHAAGAAKGSDAQRAPATVAEQRHAIRAARAVPGINPRIFDTAEQVLPPVAWTADLADVT